MTIKKLYLDEFGNVITVDGGDSMSNGLLLNGVGISAGREPNQNTEELVKRWNAYDANQQEIADLKQLAETKNARTLERIGRIEQQEREIAELKSLAAYAEQRANMLTKANEALKAKLQSAKADAVNDMVETIREVGPPNQLEASIRTHNSICNAIEGCVKVMREGKS